MTAPGVIRGIWLPDAALVLVAAGVAAVTAYLMEHGSYDSWAAIPVAVALMAVSVPMLRAAARREADPWIGKLLWWVCGLKVLGAIPRYVVIFGVYDGQADAASYSRVGAEVAAQFRGGDFDVDVGRAIQGTGFIRLLTGMVYTVTGPTQIGGFLVFAWLGFWGLYLFHRAFVRACPEGDARRYAVLVFFLPSLLFWPSSIGKEAWICLSLGVCAYGAARLLTSARGGITAIAVGVGMLLLVRPHIAALIGLAVFLAFLVKRPPRDASVLAPIGKLAGIVVLGVGLVLTVNQMEDFFGVDEFDREAVETTLNEVARQTGQGGSQFAAPIGSTTDLSPSRFPEAFVGVMFRPFPWEATNLQSLLASVESIVLMTLLVTSWRRILGALRSIVRTPYVAMCVVYTVLFVYGFSAFSNAGILVRQRVQVLPFVLVLLCLPVIDPKKDGGWRALLGAEQPAGSTTPRG